MWDIGKKPVLPGMKSSPKTRSGFTLPEPAAPCSGKIAFPRTNRQYDWTESNK